MPPSQSGNIKVTLEGRGKLTLRPGDYMTSGGEGSIYRSNGTVIKIFMDPVKMKTDDMVAKIGLLTGLKHGYIVSPENIVIDDRSNPVGFYLPYVEGEPLARVFTTSFRQRNKFGDDEAITLVDRMREAMKAAHDFKAIMVDPNELNWLVHLLSNNGPEPRVIDVDSWAIDRWQARVIMPSIRDWHSKSFGEFSDWFSWGIITFQVFTGVHPYKGRLDGFKNNDFEARMKANASVFDPNVRLNRAVRDFGCIPGPLLEWYKLTFQDGTRTVPPSPFDKAIGKVAMTARTYRSVAATGALVFNLVLRKANNSAIRVWPCGVAILDSGELVDISSKETIGQMTSPEGEVTRVQGGWLIADWVNGRMQFTFVNERNYQAVRLDLSLRANRIFRYENRMFIVTDKELIELNLMIMTRPILAIGQRTPILQPKAIKWFDGVGIQDAMGAIFVIAPFDDSSCISLRVKELDELSIITAQAGHRFITVIGADKQGVYYKIDIVPDRNYSSYKFYKTEVDSPELNIAVLPKGVCATIDGDGELRIFVPVSGDEKKVTDSNIKTDFMLYNWDNKVVYVDKGEVWTVRMK